MTSTNKLILAVGKPNFQNPNIQLQSKPRFKKVWQESDVADSVFDGH